MKNSTLKELQFRLQYFESEILFNKAYDDLNILSAFIDKKEDKNRGVIIVSEDGDFESAKALANEFFGNLSCKVIKQKEVASSSATIVTGNGIRSEKSNNWGTVGGIFTRANSPLKYGLSNTHVLAPDSPDDGDICFYYPNVKAGRLFRWHKLRRPPHVNKMDAAIFAINPNHNTRRIPIPRRPIVGPRINLKVKKDGARTNITKGYIKAYNGSSKVKLNNVIYNFSGIMAIKSNSGHFNLAGDSGSLVFTEEGNHMVGLVFAKYNEYCYALPISQVKRLLQ